MHSEFRCAACGHARFNVLYSDLADLHLEKPTSYRATLVRCDNCSLIAQWPQPSDAQLASFYPDDYSPYRTTRRSPMAATRVRRLLGVLLGAMLSETVTRHRKSGRILDVGCSNGRFLSDMAALSGWECVGIEIGHTAVEMARAQGLVVHEMDLNQLTPSADLGVFDVVTMWDVLEHLRQPVDVLQRISSMLKPGGLVMIGIPNFASTESKLFGRYWSGIEAPRHLYVFDPKTIRSVVESAGYEVVEIRTGIGLYSTFVNTLVFWLRGRGMAYSRSMAIVRALRSTLLRRIVEPFMQLGAFGLRGSKMIVVARRAS